MVRNTWVDNSMTVSSLRACRIATPSARIAGSPSMRKIPFFRPVLASVCDHWRDHVCSQPMFFHADCRHHAESFVQHAQDREQLLAWCVLHKAVVGHDDGELWFFVWMSVMWIVCGSGSHAVAARGSETCVCVSSCVAFSAASGPMGTLLPLAFLSS